MKINKQNIYPDRIEFFNPGRFAEGLSLKKLLKGNYISAIRNKQIASIFKEAGIIEKYGSGIKRIMAALKLYNLPFPRFEEIQNGFKVTVFKNHPENHPENQCKPVCA